MLQTVTSALPPAKLTVQRVAAAQQPQQPAMALLSLVQHFIAQLASQQPAAAQPPPATVPYVLPEGGLHVHERRWFTAAQAVLADTELRPEVRRFVETSTAASLAAATAGRARRPSPCFRLVFGSVDDCLGGAKVYNTSLTVLAQLQRQGHMPAASKRARARIPGWLPPWQSPWARCCGRQASCGGAGPLMCS
jgi:hypothetical protein